MNGVVRTLVRASLAAGLPASSRLGVHSCPQQSGRQQVHEMWELRQADASQVTHNIRAWREVLRSCCNRAEAVQRMLEGVWWCSRSPDRRTQWELGGVAMLL